jgi:hypothetical protein
LVSNDPAAWFEEPLPPITEDPVSGPELDDLVPGMLTRARQVFAAILNTHEIERSRRLNPLA